MRGARSGTTFGVVSADRFVLLNQEIHDRRPSLDWIVTTPVWDGLFSKPGDSAGWVYDHEGCLIGSVVGMASGIATKRTNGRLEQSHDSLESWHYIVPIDATFRDIERTTGCRVTLTLGLEDDI